MFSFKLGNTTIHLWPLILVFLIGILGVIIRAFLLSSKNKKMIKLCRIGEYDELIVIASKQLNYYRRVLTVFKNNRTRLIVDMLYLLIAISNLGLSNDNLFIQNISFVSDDNSEKHFWLALFYLLKNDSDKFQSHYDILSSKRNIPDYLSYLSALKQYQESSDSDAQDILSALYSKLNFKLLKDISKKIIDKRD